MLLAWLRHQRILADYIGLYEGDADLLIASLSLIQKTATDILVAIADPIEQETNDAGLQEPAPLPIAA